MSEANDSANQQPEGEKKKLPQSQSAYLAQVDSDELAKKRTGYYDKWRHMTKEEAEKAKEEEEAEKQRAAEKLGLQKDEPKSEAEKADREKREALREAKKTWEGRKAAEEEMKYVFAGHKNLTKEVKPEDVSHRPVLVIQKCEDCKLVLSEELGNLIKIFVSDCARTEITLACNLITQHIEISHCEDMKLVVARPTETIQIDLVDGMEVTYNQNVLQEGHKLYHAGVKKLVVHQFGTDSARHDYTNLEDTDANIPAEERQYLTHLKDGLLVTERVRLGHGIMPLTESELSKLAGTEAIETAHLRQATNKKECGNEAFKTGEHLQAAVFYTQAMQLAPHENDLLCQCLANRAACNLKLGRLEEAYDDAVACIAINDKFVKGWFRKGIALHAQKKYGPAIEALSRADALEPKNKQIQEAIGFAKVMLQKQLKEQAEKWS